MSLSILFSCAGRRVELMECFRRAALELNITPRILATDAAPELSAACLRADEWVTVPRCDDPSFVDRLLEICARFGVKLLVPTIDTELLALAPHVGRFQAVGTLLAISSEEVIEIARDKLRTDGWLRSLDLPTPRTVNHGEALAGRISFPVVAKPRAGSASAGIYHCPNLGQLRDADLPGEKYIVQEFWGGKEYTVNLFFDRTRLRCAIPHLRLETRGGEVSKGLTERHLGLLSAAQRIGKALAGRAFGALCFQAIVRPSEQYAITEINARFGGGYPLADQAGAKFARWLLEIVLGRECTAHHNWAENVRMLRYDSSVFNRLGAT